MYAVNNGVVNYLNLAKFNARLVKRHLNVPVSLVTNEDTLKDEAAAECKELFDRLITVDDAYSYNPRSFKDTRYYSVQGQFHNKARASAYELSPYDETLLIDVDYLIYDDSLSGCWGSLAPLRMNRDAVRVGGTEITGTERWLSPFGPRMYWATVIYFQRSPEAELFFDLVNHAKENWNFYAARYQFPGHLYRNDYAVSVAAHTLSGFQEPPAIPPLPTTKLLTLLDLDQPFELLPNGLKVFVNHQQESWKFYALRVENQSVHCINKLALLNLIGGR